jgi:hypothetical protein
MVVLNGINESWVIIALLVLILIEQSRRRKTRKDTGGERDFVTGEHTPVTITITGAVTSTADTVLVLNRETQYTVAFSNATVIRFDPMEREDAAKSLKLFRIGRTQSGTSLEYEPIPVPISTTTYTVDLASATADLLKFTLKTPLAAGRYVFIRGLKRRSEDFTAHLEFEVR